MEGFHVRLVEMGMLVAFCAGVFRTGAAGGGRTTVILIVVVPVLPPEPVAMMVSRFEAEAAVGVPEILQVLSMESPEGSGCEAMQEVIGPPVEVGICVASLVTVSITELGV